MARRTLLLVLITAAPSDSRLAVVAVFDDGAAFAQGVARAQRRVPNGEALLQSVVSPRGVNVARRLREYHRDEHVEHVPTGPLVDGHAVRALEVLDDVADRLLFENGRDPSLDGR